MLRVEDIHAYYGDSHVLQGVSLAVNEGEIVCLLGRNGKVMHSCVSGGCGQIRILAKPLHVSFPPILHRLQFTILVNHGSLSDAIESIC